MQSDNIHRVVCFGEVLWDILPTGAVPGGAPMNVAYHLHKQKKNPAIITKIGIDQEGKDLINIFSGKGVCTDFFQVDYEYETGKIYTKRNEQNEVTHDIVQPAAWDFIQREVGLKELVQDAEFFVFGSLAARNKTSKDTLFSLLEAAKNKVLDINLQAPHFNRQTVQELLEKTDFLKINRDELELITGWFSNYSNTEDRVKAIMDKFKITTIAVTMGGDGATLFMNGAINRHYGFKADVADTVGSEDAFLAGLLSKLLDNAGSKEALNYAITVGAFIATQRGACPEYELEEIKEPVQNAIIKV
jgi:fructokinase